MYLRWGETSATFPEGGNLTLYSGIFPSTISLGIPPPDDLEELERIATITLGDGEDPDDEETAGNKLILADCRIIDGSLHKDTRSVPRCSFVARDFRWRWALAEPVTGEYNRRDSDGFIVGTKKTARELVWLLYELLPCPAIRDPESVNAVPDDQYPYVDWDNKNPAEAMEEICEQFSLLICPALGEILGGDTALAALQIFAIGEGEPLPELPAVETDDSLFTQDIPANLRVVGGKTIEQSWVELTAVGLDPAAGEYRPLTSDSLVWYEEYYYAGFEREISDEEVRKAAEETAFRAYRLPESVTIGGIVYLRAEALRRIRNHLVEKDAEDSENRYLPAYIAGEHATDEALTDPELYYSTSTRRVDVPWHIDEEQGLIVFHRQVFGFDPINHDQCGAELTLYCAWEAETYTRDYIVIDGIDELWQTVHAPDVFLEQIVNSSTGLIEVQNAVVTHAAATLHAQAYAQRWRRPEQVTSRLYAGIIKTLPDGCVEQVTWSISGGGPVTRLSWGAEHDLAVLPRNLRNRARDLNDPVRAKRAKAAGVRLDAAAFDEGLAEVGEIDPSSMGGTG